MYLTLFKENFYVIEDLRKEDFDIYLGVQVMPFDTLIGKTLEVPTMMWLAYLPNPVVAVLLNLPS